MISGKIENSQVKQKQELSQVVKIKTQTIVQPWGKKRSLPTNSAANYRIKRITIEHKNRVARMSINKCYA